MKRPRRNIEIFSMSVLDMFASALGAFIMVTVILFPYFKKDVGEDLKRAGATLAQVKDDIEATRDKVKQSDQDNMRQGAEVRRTASAHAGLQQCQAGLTRCLAESAKNFLLVQIEWSEPVDVNLHVTDTAGNEFSWIKANRSGRDFPGSKARLSIDVSKGPGIEVWVDEDAKPGGTYQIDYVVPRNPPRPVQVKGILFDRSGKKVIPPRTLGDGTLRVKAATVKIANDGVVELQ